MIFCVEEVPRKLGFYYFKYISLYQCYDDELS